jgi:acyl-ACP thioesterase
MLEKIGTFHFLTEPYLLDFRGRATIPIIGNYLLHVAGNHASARGFGFHAMSEKHTAWVLSRLAIEMKRYPTLAEPVTLYTWIDEVGRLFTNRCFELADGEGKPFGYARSIWAAIDMETRRPTPLDVDALSAYIAPRPCPIDRPGKIAPLDVGGAGDADVPYRVKYSDLDINEHLNSIKYMEHLLDLFDLSLFRTHEVSRFEIHYLSEGKYDMPLTLHKSETAPYRYTMEIHHEGKAICRATARFT